MYRGDMFLVASIPPIIGERSLLGTANLHTGMERPIFSISGILGGYLTKTGIEELAFVQ